MKRKPSTDTASGSPMPTSVKIMTVQEVADLLQIPKGGVYEKTRTRRGGAPPLPCRRVGKYLRFLESEVLAWLLGLPQNERRGRRAA